MVPRCAPHSHNLVCHKPHLSENQGQNFYIHGDQETVRRSLSEDNTGAGPTKLYAGIVEESIRGAKPTVWVQSSVSYNPKLYEKIR